MRYGGCLYRAVPGIVNVFVIYRSTDNIMILIMMKMMVIVTFLVIVVVRLIVVKRVKVTEIVVNRKRIVRNT